MTSYTWQLASNGDWSASGNWSPSGGPPKSTDSATIAVTGAAYTVTVSSADVASSLTLSSVNATLNDDGASASLTIGGTLAMSNGTLNVANGTGGSLTVGALNLSGGSLTINANGQLNLGGGTLSQTGGTLTLAGGTIAGGTINSTAGALALDSGTLSGVTFDGPLNLASTIVQQTVDLANGTTVVGSSGSGPGTINVTGYSSVLNFDNTQTVGNVTINLGASGSTDTLSDNDTAGSGNKVLTLASSVIVNATGFSHFSDGGNSGDGIVNQGVINQTADGTMYVAGNAFTNNGTINAKGTGALDISAATFANSGKIDIANGDKVTIEPTTFTTTAASLITIEANSSLTVDPAHAWRNLGSITLASGASLTLYGSMSAASLGSITNSGGTVDIAGTYNNSGHTLDGSASFGQLVLLNGGTITGGTATSGGVGFANNGATLSGVTFDGPLNLTSTSVSQTVDLANGASVVGSSGSGRGTINVTGFGSQLKFDNTQTVSNETINLGNSSFLDHLYENDTAGVGAQVLTLAPSVTINVTGRAQIQTTSFSGDAIVNQGVISQTGSGSLQITGNAFTNSGTINAKGTKTLTISPTTFTNSGTISISSGDTLALSGTTSLGGKTSGAGTLAITGGATTIGAGASLPVTHWSVSGAGTNVTLGENLTYTGTFTAGSATTLNLSGGNLTLTGADSFAGATTIGSKTLHAKGTIAVSGLTIGGETTFFDAGSLSESGGSAILGDAAADVARLTITSMGTWDILDDSGIGLGTSTSSSITNSGLLEKTGETGVSTIAPAINNAGTIEVSSGTLDLEGAVSGTGTDTIENASTLEFDAPVSSAKTVGAQNIGFTGNGGTLDLTSPNNFWAEISGFAAGDAIDLLGSWAFSGVSHGSGVTTLTLASGATKQAFTFVGDYSQGDFSITSGATTIIKHT